MVSVACSSGSKDGDKGLECGDGTVERDGKCIVLECGPGTLELDGKCVKATDASAEAVKEFKQLVDESCACKDAKCIEGVSRKMSAMGKRYAVSGFAKAGAPPFIDGFHSGNRPSSRMALRPTAFSERNCAMTSECFE